MHLSRKKSIYFLFTILYLIQCNSLIEKVDIEKVKEIVKEKIKIENCLEEEYFFRNLNLCYDRLKEFYSYFENLENQYLKLLDVKNRLYGEVIELRKNKSSLEKIVEDLEKENLNLKGKIDDLQNKNIELVEKIPSVWFIFKLGSIFFFLGFLSRYVFKFLFNLIKSKIPFVP